MYPSLFSVFVSFLQTIQQKDVCMKTTKATVLVLLLEKIKP